jgi:hypothetical protein
MHKIPDEAIRGVICPIFKEENGRGCNIIITEESVY